MTDKQKSYSYMLNANLVLQGQNRDGGEQRAKGRTEPSGEGESLSTRKLAKFGDRVVKTKPTEEDYGKQIVPKSAKEQETHDLKQVNLVTMKFNQELVYRPKTKETQAVYEQIVYMVQKHLGDESTETVLDCTDEVITLLKNDTVSLTRRKEEMDVLFKLTPFNSDEFNSIVVLTQKLTDFEVGSVEKQDLYMDKQDIAIDLDESEDDNQQVQEIQEEYDEERSQHEKPDQFENIEVPQNDQNEYEDSLLKLDQINEDWLKTQIIQSYNEISDEEVSKIQNTVLGHIGNESMTLRECEKKLLQMLGPKRIQLIKTLVKQRYIIFYGTLKQQARSPQEKRQVEEMMQKSTAGRQILMQIKLEREHDQMIKRTDEAIKGAHTVSNRDREIKAKQGLQVLDLNSLKFAQGPRLMANKKCVLPKGSTRLTKSGYEEVYVPAIRHKQLPDEKLVAISSLPEWSRRAFPTYMTHLNRIQSALYKQAFTSADNLLVCAPTGAGKTNIAMLSILQLLSENRSTHNGKENFDFRSFKIIYIAPMKALVTEVVGNFQARLETFGVKVRELTGDVHLSKHQIEETNIIVTTPEKWDIITRKSGERAYVELVKLVIIDEVHLLHDSRGPVLESIIARTIRQVEETSEMVRIVGLSATLPNYQDVAALLRVNPKTGLFFFDQTHRPVPLEQIFVGITEKKAIKRMILMNEVCYEKIIERVEKHQMIVFTHSRKETARTAKIIRDMALAQDKLQSFAKEGSESKKILLDVIVEKKLAVSKDLQDLVPFGIGIHHAGLSKNDRSLVEDLFAAGHLKVLVSTATLAWGVNLPAHTVIIKGTQIYSPEQGKWVELSPQDILQMMGRAGRPQYDTLGEGIIITSHSDLQYYLSLNNQQLPIESQMISALADQLNAEIVLGTISNLKEAVNWMAYTYLYIRMRRNPELYGVDKQDFVEDPTLIHTRMNLVHSAALKLQNSGMIKYDRRSGALVSTSIGKVASHYYIKCDSMQMYNEELKPQMNTIDVFRLFALSKEFENIPIRESEKVELQKFIERVPIPVKGSMEESATKINILLQAYIARFKLEGYDLNADMVYITQSASRIMRALYEISLKKGWAMLAESLLNACKMVEKRQWYSMTPLRQFANALNDPIQASDLMEIAKKIERKEQFKWVDFYDFSAQKLGELIKFPKMGKVILNYVHKFPRLDISAFVQPITRSTIRIELEIKAHELFQWDSKFHGWAEPFWIFLEDGDSEQILHYEQFVLKENMINVEHHLSFAVPLFDPLPPQYFIKVISDRWLQAEHVVPVSFKQLILPDKYPAPTQLNLAKNKNIRDLGFDEIEEVFAKDQLKEFSPIQSQAFDQLYFTDNSLFLGVPSGGSEKRILAELAIAREIQKDNFGKIVYISPKKELCKSIYNNWNSRLGENGLGLNVELLSDDFSGQIQKDMSAIQKGDIIISTPEKWDQLSRKWRSKKVLLQVGMYIFDDLHLISDRKMNATLEVVASRVRTIQNEVANNPELVDDREIQHNVRIIAQAAPIANAKDICEWLGVDFEESCFNFSPSVRAQCPSIGGLQMNIMAFDQNNRHHRVLQMAKPSYNLLKKSFLQSDQCKGLIFVSDKKQAQITAFDMVKFCTSDENEDIFNGNEAKIDADILSENAELVDYGVSFLHSGLSLKEQSIMINMFKQNQLRLLVLPVDYCWHLSELNADIIIVQDTECYKGHERRYEDIPFTDILQMQSLAVSQDGISKFVVMCHYPKKDLISKFVQDPLPVESTLAHNLHDHLCAEVAADSISSIQEAIDWTTWSFLYRRIVKNPNFYEIVGRTPQHINDFLSELIEDTVSDLSEAGCISVLENEMDLEPANLGRIASFYYLKFQTMDSFQKGLQSLSKKQLKLKQLLEILCHSTELEVLLDSSDIPEDELRLLAFNLPFDIPENADYQIAHIKAFILLQCYFSRRQVTSERKADQMAIIEQSERLVHAMVDIISSLRLDDENAGNLRPSILCMELSQMLVQAIWMNQSALMQLPFLTKSMIEKLSDSKVEDIADFMNMEDAQREQLVPLPQDQMSEVARVCNRYPNIELLLNSQKLRISDNQIVVTLKRDIEESDFDTYEEYLAELQIFASPVNSKFFPTQKQEMWWIVVGQPSANRLLSIKKVTNMHSKPELSVPVSFVLDPSYLASESQELQRQRSLRLKVYLICDSYIGADAEKEVIVEL